MNAERLREVAELLIQKEKQFPIQTTLDQLATELSQLVGSPQQQQFQVQYATTLERLKKLMAGLSQSFTPAQVVTLKEIEAYPYFVDDIAEQIERIATQNPLTPAVTNQRLQEIISKRQTYLTNIQELQQRLASVGILAAKPPPGTAELGVLIPRALFQNRLDEFIKELSVLNRVVRIFGEIANENAQSPEVHQISSSDPLLFLGMDPKTLAVLGMAVTWALDRLKTVMEIRKLRSEAKKSEIFSDKEVEEIFDKKITQTIAKAVDEKVQEMMGQPAQVAGRHHELRTELSWALESIFSRIERGVTMEVRFLPPEQKKVADGTVAPEPSEFGTLRSIVQKLDFPAVEASPVLKLPPPEPPEAAEPPKPPKKAVKE